MTDVQFPPRVEDFMRKTAAFLEHFELKLEMKEINAGSQSKIYTVAANDGVVEVIVHRTAWSLDEEVGEYRVRVIAPVAEDFSEYSRGAESAINQVATLGALVDEAKAVACQCLIPERDAGTTAGLLALAIAECRMSLIASHVRVMRKEQARAVETLSAWTDLDFEIADYDYAHLGRGIRRQRGWQMQYFGGALLTLDAVHNNPYWGGGLLALLRMPKAAVAGPNASIDANGLNKIGNLLGRTPTFGAWCEAEDDFTFVQFLPNFIKPLDNLTDHVILWASARSDEARHFAELMAVGD
jgi:hypothetical protein